MAIMATATPGSALLTPGDHMPGNACRPGIIRATGLSGADEG